MEQPSIIFQLLNIFQTMSSETSIKREYGNLFFCSPVTKFKVELMLTYSSRYYKGASLRGSRWPSGRIGKCPVIKMRQLRLSPSQWPKIGREATK